MPMSHDTRRKSYTLSFDIKVKFIFEILKNGLYVSCLGYDMVTSSAMNVSRHKVQKKPSMARMNLRKMARESQHKTEHRIQQLTEGVKNDMMASTTQH